MKHKPIRLDWDELEVAFTNHDEEIVYYLDLVTGNVTERLASASICGRPA